MRFCFFIQNMCLSMLHTYHPNVHVCNFLFFLIFQIRSTAFPGDSCASCETTSTCSSILCMNSLFLSFRFGLEPAAGPFFFSLSLSLRSCNFRFCKYFTGNDCGKPRKWHPLSAAFLSLLFVHVLLLLQRSAATRRLLVDKVREQLTVSLICSPPRC